jgi:hypothetical protein
VARTVANDVLPEPVLPIQAYLSFGARGIGTQSSFPFLHNPCSSQCEIRSDWLA